MFFEQLNFSNLNLDNGLYDEIDKVTRINCKYNPSDFNSSSSKSKSLSFFHTNISSLEKHFDEYLLLYYHECSFDVIAISETRLSSSSSGNVSIPEYSFLHTPSDISAGGVGLYISDKQHLYLEIIF